MKWNKQEFLSRAGLGHETLQAWIEEEWLVPDQSADEMSFSDIDIARARLIRDLQLEFGVNDAGVGVILNLLDQLYGVRRTMMELRRSIQITSE